MLAQLSQCEFTITKSSYTACMMKQELKNYETISNAIEDGIEHAKVQIDLNKKNLILAKNIRKNRMQYDVLAKIINQQPDRKKTTETLETLNKELNELEENRRQLQRKLEIRRNEFSVLMRSIKELQTKLDDNENDKKYTNDDEDSNNNGDYDEDTTAAATVNICNDMPISTDNNDAINGEDKNNVNISIDIDYEDIENDDVIIGKPKRFKYDCISPTFLLTSPTSPISYSENVPINDNSPSSPEYIRDIHASPTVPRETKYSITSPRKSDTPPEDF